MRRLPLPSLPLILIIALLLRTVWVILIPVEPISDAAAYDLFARNIVEHGVYGWTPEEPGAYWAVGAAAIYAGAYTVFGIGDLGVIAVNMVSSMAAVWALAVLGARWIDDEVGRLAALLFAVWPLLIQYTTVMASELHFIALLLLGLVAWTQAELTTRRGWLMILLSGLALGLATYVRPVALLVPAALAVAALLRSPKRGVLLSLQAALVTVIIFATVSPWSARNERIFGERVFMSTNFWPNFWMGNNPETTGQYQPLPNETHGMGEIERSAYTRSLAMEYLKEEPVAFVWRTLGKALTLHDRETIGVVWNEAALNRLFGPTGVTAAKAVSTGFWYVALLAAMAGIVALCRGIGWWAALLSMPVWLWLYFTAIHAIIVAGDRYHIPALPMVALLAASGLRWLRQPDWKPDKG